MKNILSLFLLTFLIGCSSNHQNPEIDTSSIKENITFYGKEISNDSLQVFNQEKEMVMNTGLKSCKFSGKIVETCSKKGCWMTLDTG